MRTSPTEQQDHLSRWRTSGTSMAAYCREHQIPYHRMVYWRQRASLSEQCLEVSEHQSEADDPHAFDCIDLTQEGHLGSPVPRMEILFPNGVCLQVHALVHPDELRATIEVVNAC